jgi:hypothetical protein
MLKVGDLLGAFAMDFVPSLTVEDTIIAVYCAIDDALNTAGVAENNGKRVDRPGPRPLLSDCEVLCLSILQEILGFESDNSFFLWLQNSPLIHSLFPMLIARQKFAERRALLTGLAYKLSEAFRQLSGEGQPPFSSSIPIRSMSAGRNARATNPA